MRYANLLQHNLQREIRSKVAASHQTCRKLLKQDKGPSTTTRTTYKLPPERTKWRSSPLQNRAIPSLRKKKKIPSVPLKQLTHCVPVNEQNFWKALHPNVS